MELLETCLDGIGEKGRMVIPFREQETAALSHPAQLLQSKRPGFGQGPLPDHHAVSTNALSQPEWTFVQAAVDPLGFESPKWFPHPHLVVWSRAVDQHLKAQGAIAIHPFGTPAGSHDACADGSNP